MVRLAPPIGSSQIQALLLALPSRWLVLVSILTAWQSESAEVWEEAGLCVVGVGGLGLALSVLLFSLTHGLSQRVHGPLTTHPPTEQELWCQSRGDRKLSRTRGGGGIVIDSSYNSSRNGVGAPHLIL